MITIALEQEQQQRLERDRVGFDCQRDREFDALSFELKHSQDYQNSQSGYVEYEIDSIKEEFGELWRVWDKCILVGTFYETSQGWKAVPFYLCRQYIKGELDFSKSCENSGSAIAYIKLMYEGISQSLTSEQIHLIAA